MSIPRNPDAPTTVEAHTSLDAYTARGDHATGEIGLLWRSNMADAVQVLIVQDGWAMVRWTLARTLLADGCDGPAGIGDVFVCPDIDWGSELIEVVLRSPVSVTHNLKIMLRREFVQRFLADTYRHVPAGAAWAENLDPSQIGTEQAGGAAA